MLRLWKNSSVSFIIGAADAMNSWQRSKPRARRTALNTSQSASVQPYGKLPLNNTDVWLDNSLSVICCHMGTAIKHPVPDRVKLSFVIFDIRALWRSALSARVPDVKNYKWRLNPVWHRFLYSCTREFPLKDLQLLIPTSGKNHTRQF